MKPWTLREGVIIGVGLENIALIDIASDARKWLPASALDVIDRWLEDGIRDSVASRGLGDVYKRQREKRSPLNSRLMLLTPPLPTLRLT